MKRNSGLQKRWLRNTLSILFAIVLLCVIALSIMVAAYYYSSMEAGMEAKARTSTSFFDNYVRQSYNEYYQSCAKFAQSFDSKDQMELQFVNTNNRIVASSYGVYSGMAGVTSDIREAIETKAIASYTGTNPATGERIMAVLQPAHLYKRRGHRRAALCHEPAPRRPADHALQPVRRACRPDRAARCLCQRPLLCQIHPCPGAGADRHGQAHLRWQLWRADPAEVRRRDRRADGHHQRNV